MDFLRSNFFKNEPQLPIFSSKLDSLVIKTLELSECLSNVLITGESDLDERNGKLIRGS